MSRLASVAFFAIALIPEVRGCSCAPPEDSCPDARNAEIVFVGTVRAAGNSTPERLWALVRDYFKGSPSWARRQISFRVEETFFGAHLPVRDIWGNWGNCCDCGLSFEYGSRYLVYVDFNKSTGHEETSVCAGTRQLNGKPDAGVAFMRAVRQGSTQARIRGAVTVDGKEFDRRRRWLLDSIEHPAAPGVRVRLQSERETKALTTDASGMFDFPTLLGGRYVLTATAPGYRFPNLPQAIDIPKGCGAYPILAQPAID